MAPLCGVSTSPLRAPSDGLRPSMNALLSAINEAHLIFGLLSGSSLFRERVHNALPGPKLCRQPCLHPQPRCRLVLCPAVPDHGAAVGIRRREAELVEGDLDALAAGALRQEAAGAVRAGAGALVRPEVAQYYQRAAVRVWPCPQGSLLGVLGRMQLRRHQSPYQRSRPAAAAGCHRRASTASEARNQAGAWGCAAASGGRRIVPELVMLWVSETTPSVNK